MRATLEGTVLEVYKRMNKENKEITVARMFQPGERNLIDVKNVPADTKTGSVQKFTVSLFAWASKNGVANVSVEVVG